MTPLRIQKTSAFKDEQQHNSLHNATVESLHPHPSAFYHSFQGKKDALERLETETMNQGGKNVLSCLQNYSCRVLSITGDNSQPTRHKHSPALLKGPELCGLSHLSAPTCFTKHQQQTLLLPSSTASVSSSLNRGSLCSKVKAQVLPSPAQSLARQLQFVQNKWIFQLCVIPQETEF